MSLDVSLRIDGALSQGGSGIFIRENGTTREITQAEWDERFPGTEPVRAIHHDDESGDVYSANITHNLNAMAEAAGIYKALWRPEEIGITHAHQLIPLLTEGLAKLEADPDEYEKHNSPNGWGMYEHFVPFVRDYLQACQDYPTASVSVSR